MERGRLIKPIAFVDADKHRHFFDQRELGTKINQSIGGVTPVEVGKCGQSDAPEKKEVHASATDLLFANPASNTAAIEIAGRVDASSAHVLPGRAIS